MTMPRSAGVNVSMTWDFIVRKDDCGVKVRNIDYKTLSQALRSLLTVLPDDAAPDAKAPVSELRRLRSDIIAVIDRLVPLSRALDPIRQPAFVFDPTNPEIVGQLIGGTMMEQPRYPLGTVPKFYGSGVYAIFYNGDYEAYGPIRRKNTPIYVGKADPPTPNAKTVEEQGPKLSSRLGEHAKSVSAAKSTLKLDDFECRFLVVQSGWQRSAEDYLVGLFRPIWNYKICHGFGKHGDDPKTRANTRSPWDTLHPGRLWATREGNVKGTLTTGQIRARIKEHFLKHPPSR
jgi:hypothetical protein